MSPPLPDELTIDLPAETRNASTTVLLDSQPILAWLAAARKQGAYDPIMVRRALIARMIWQASYQRSPGLLENVAYLLGWPVWGADRRGTLAADLWSIRQALRAVGQRLRYRHQPDERGFYIVGRPALDPRLERGLRGALAEVDPAQMKILRLRTPAYRVAQAASMIAAAEEVGTYRLQLRQPQLTSQNALQIIRQKRVA